MSTGYQQHHTSSHKSSKSESHELSEIHDNPVSAGYGANNQYNQTSLPGAQHAAALPGAQHSALPAPQQSAAQASYSAEPTATSSPLPGTAYTTGAGIADPVTSTPSTQTTSLGSHRTPGATTAARTGPAYNNGATPTTGTQNTVPTHTGGQNTAFPGSHTGVRSGNTSLGDSFAAPVQEVSQLNVSSPPGTGAHSTTVPDRTGGHVPYSTPGTHNTGLGAHNTASSVPAIGTTHNSTVPGHHTTHRAPADTAHHVPTTAVGGSTTSSPAAYNSGAVPTTTTTTHAPTNKATSAAAQNADVALNRALNASNLSPGAARVGGSSMPAHSAPGTVAHTSGVNPAPVDRSAVNAADSAAQALGHVLGGAPSATVGQPRAVQSTTTTPAGVHSALHTTVPTTVTHTNTATGAPATMQTASSGLATHSQTTVPAATSPSAVPNSPAYNNSVPAGGVHSGITAPGGQTTTTTSPAAGFGGAHPNPTHVSNQYRPGSTYNTASTGAAAPGAVPPAYKEGKYTSANLPGKTL